MKLFLVRFICIYMVKLHLVWVEVVVPQRRVDRRIQVLYVCTVHAVDEDDAKHRWLVQFPLLFYFPASSCA